MLGSCEVLSPCPILLEPSPQTRTGKAPAGRASLTFPKRPAALLSCSASLMMMTRALGFPREGVQIHHPSPCLAAKGRNTIWASKHFMTRSFLLPSSPESLSLALQVESGFMHFRGRSVEPCRKTGQWRVHFILLYHLSALTSVVFRSPLS